MMNIMRFSMSTARKKLAWVRVVRGEEVVELEAHAGHVGAELIERLRVLQVDQSKPGVGIGDAGLERADQRELLEARDHAGGRDQALRRDQRDLVARQHAERAREIDAEHHAELARLQRIERSRAHVAAEIGDLRFFLGQDAAHDRAAHRLPGREHRLRLHEWGSGEHVRAAGGELRYRRPIGQAIVERDDLHVRGDAEDARAYLLLEAVHHREHDDQRPHADEDADHRDEGVDADEAIAAPCPRVAQADKELVSHEVARGYYNRPDGRRERAAS
jgi:hypothetical protein